ncbi:hypothetical protein LOK49_LG08G01183 [Camellia lanceoleosa]|uniref:Uncharacterized protein n=1 Tax=Camellia lanceoleosa TaxID=1840588 RepID=A0ACC0GRS4_9ERIC|nr:hypothetical protein LOK49_LG08G01183 [Camellia lanceoleosa]
MMDKMIVKTPTIIAMLGLSGVVFDGGDGGFAELGMLAMNNFLPTLPNPQRSLEEISVNCEKQEKVVLVLQEEIEKGHYLDPPCWVLENAMKL